MTPALITAQAAKDRACNKRTDKRLWHDDSREQKFAAKAEINQTSHETAPVIGEFFADQEDHRDRGDYRESNRQPGGGGTHAKTLERNNDEPVEKRRFLQNRKGIVCGQEPLLCVDPLSRPAGVF